MIPIRDYNPTTRTPYVNVALIAACVLVFLWQASLDPRSGQMMVYQLGFIPALLFGQGTFGADAGLVPAWVTLFTSMFLHGGFMHLAGNMLYLWIFGNNIEDVMGHGRFLVFYLLCGLVAAMGQALPDLGSTVPMIGASGAISGVLGAYLVLFPKAQVQVVIPIGFFMMRKLTAGWLLGLWIAFQVISGLSEGLSGGGVAWWAHVGGFVAGMVLVHPFRQKEIAKALDPGLPSARVPAKPLGRTRIPDSREQPPARPEPRHPSEPPPLPDRPTVQRRRDPPSGRIR
ncbi:MAG: rhomboid family intramembrane serine protease [Alphaproteobacteria bacterium]